MPSRDEFWMRRALDLAAKGIGLTSPNPCVGAVIVRGGKVLGEGFHRKAGGPHAEVAAIQNALKAGHSLKSATIYITLEPCCTHGRTPPCTDLILRHKFRRVVVAATDPNPAHAGAGFKMLEKAGIAVSTGVLANESNRLNRAFNHWIVTRRPWVVLKLALSQDGYLKRPGQSRWLTSGASRRDVQKIRRRSDAILVGAETLRADNPKLTVRGHRVRSQPWRIVISKSGRIPRKAVLFTDEFKDRTIVYQNKSWPAILSELGKKPVLQLMVEGGAHVADEMIAGKLVHEVVIYFAPFKVSPPDCLRKTLPRFKSLSHLRLKDPELVQIGPDLRLSGLL